MLNPSSNALTTILFGVFGGLRKAYQLSYIIVQINPSSILSVIAYAALSAVVGYFVKIGLDYLRKTIVRIFTQKKQNKYE
jgi:phage shock protein PspC (stress-responsive transcriptional regulator)